MRKVAPRAFTIIELLVVVSIIALLVGILLPAIGKARDQAQLTVSQANLRDLGTAHNSYAAEWGDRQFTLIVDNISAYGSSAPAAFNAYNASLGTGADGRTQYHTGVYLGWGYSQPPAGGYGNWYYPLNSGFSGNFGLPQPIEFGENFFGAFRLWNCSQFNQYVSGKFYDKSFYAPKDKAVWETVKPAWDDPGQFSFAPDVQTDLGDIPAWPGYCMSPAAMFNPEVMQHDDQTDDTANGWQDPWVLAGGFRSPGYSQALYPNLKSHMIEHHWNQNVRAECNPGFEPGTYGGCEPYYFNHSRESSPVTLFYDGHVGSIGVRRAMQSDARMRNQTNQENWGLWSKDTYFGDDGYLIEYGYDLAATSFHILTTDGIRGRDVTGGQ
jgi:prepilin-type N-terminal cleavage/methylation domain-containing protein